MIELGAGLELCPARGDSAGVGGDGWSFGLRRVRVLRLCLRRKEKKGDDRKLRSNHQCPIAACPGRLRWAM